MIELGHDLKPPHRRGIAKINVSSSVPFTGDDGKRFMGFWCESLWSALVAPLMNTIADQMTETTSLLQADEPSPTLEHNASGASPFLIACDHYGRLIPRALAALGDS